MNEGKNLNDVIVRHFSLQKKHQLKQILAELRVAYQQLDLCLLSGYHSEGLLHAISGWGSVQQEKQQELTHLQSRKSLPLDYHLSRGVTYDHSGHLRSPHRTYACNYNFQEINKTPSG